MKNKGRLFVISGPSGAGKDAVISEALKIMPGLKFSISTVTRPMRPGEVQGYKYNFVSAEVFEKMLESNELLEFAVYCGNYYGTPKKPIENWLSHNDDVLIEVDVQGGEKIRKLFPGAIFVFIMPPSVKVLESRLSSRRTENPEVAKARLKAAIAEISKAVNYDYIIMNEENKVRQTAGILCDIIRNSQDCEKYQTKNMMKLIEEVLKDA